MVPGFFYLCKPGRMLFIEAELNQGAIRSESGSVGRGLQKTFNHQVFNFHSPDLLWKAENCTNCVKMQDQMCWGWPKVRPALESRHPSSMDPHLVSTTVTHWRPQLLYWHFNSFWRMWALLQSSWCSVLHGRRKDTHLNMMWCGKSMGQYFLLTRSEEPIDPSTSEARWDRLWGPTWLTRTSWRALIQTKWR